MEIIYKHPTERRFIGETQVEKTLRWPPCTWTCRKGRGSSWGPFGGWLAILTPNQVEGRSGLGARKLKIGSQPKGLWAVRATTLERTDQASGCGRTGFPTDCRGARGRAWAHRREPRLSPGSPAARETLRLRFHSHACPCSYPENAQGFGGASQAFLHPASLGRPCLSLGVQALAQPRPGSLQRRPGAAGPLAWGITESSSKPGPHSSQI